MRTTQPLGHPQLLLACGGLCFLGALPLVQAVTHPGAPDGSLSLGFPFLLSFGLGLLAVFAVLRVDLRAVLEKTPALLGVSLAILALSALPAWKAVPFLRDGVTPINDSLFRALFLIFVAGLLASRKGSMKNLRTWYRILLYLVPALFLLMLRPAPGEVIMLSGILVAALYLAGARTSLVYGLTGAAFVLFAALLAADVPALDWLKPWKTSTAYLYAAMYAPSSYAAGGMWGSHAGDLQMPLLLNSPEFSGFVLPALSERFGAMCVLAALLLTVSVVLTGLHLAADVRKLFHGLLAGLVSFSLALGALVNLASTAALIPPVGVPFPFLNIYSPSYLWCGLAAGLLFNISALRNREAAPAVAMDTAVIETCELPLLEELEEVTASASR